MKNKILGIVLAFICCFCFLLAGCGETPNEYSINVLINGARFGSVEDVSGTYTEGTSVTVTALPKSGETFFCWIHDSKVVSGEKSYTFSVNEKNSGTYIALFKCPDLEYFSLDSIDFLNAIPEESGENKIKKLTEISLSFGYTQTDMYEVYTCKEQALPTSENSFVSSETIYAEDKLPFAFDKTRNLYIKILTTYTVTIGESIDTYQSETTITLNKTDIGKDVENKEEIVLSNNVNVNNENLILETDDNHNKLTINFKKLSDFNFSEQTEENPEDEQSPETNPEENPT